MKRCGLVLLCGVLLTACTPRPAPLPPSVPPTLAMPTATVRPSPVPTLGPILAEDGTPLSVVQEFDGVRVCVDPRLELLSVVQAIGNYDQRYGLITELEFTYKQELLDYFSPYAGHEAVTLFDALSQKGFNFNRPPELMLLLNDRLQLPSEAELPADLLAYGYTYEELETWVSALSRFAQEAGFAAFYASNQVLYHYIVPRTGGNLTPGLISDLERYYGVGQHSYNLMLVPLFHSGGFGPRLEAPGGGYDLYSIIGPSDRGPAFGGGKENLAALIEHEFGHSFVNPVTAAHADEVQARAALFAPIQAVMTDMAYSSWETCVNEHILRAVEARSVLKAQGEAAYRAVLEQEKARGFRYVELLAEKLGAYEAGREQYPTFADFYPELLTALDSVKL